MELAATPGAEGPPEEAIKLVGCAHYKRKSKFVVGTVKNNLQNYIIYRPQRIPKSAPYDLNIEFPTFSYFQDMLVIL